MSSTASLCRRSEARRCDGHHDAFVVHVAVLLRGAVVVHVYILRRFCCSLVVRTCCARAVSVNTIVVSLILTLSLVLSVSDRKSKLQD